MAQREKREQGREGERESGWKTQKRGKEVGRQNKGTRTKEMRQERRRGGNKNRETERKFERK